jgi:hypothetical protein
MPSDHLVDGAPGMSDFGVELERWMTVRQIGVRELTKRAGRSSQPSGKSRPSPVAAEISTTRSGPEANCGALALPRSSRRWPCDARHRPRQGGWLGTPDRLTAGVRSRPDGKRARVPRARREDEHGQRPRLRCRICASSLALELGLTLVGLLRGFSMNVYTGADGIPG